MLLFLCTNLDIAKDGSNSDEKLMEASDIRTKHGVHGDWETGPMGVVIQKKSHLHSSVEHDLIIEE
jgi:hypothetical protein